MHAFLIRELERELPNKTSVRSEIAELSEMPPSLLLKELQDRGLLAP